MVYADVTELCNNLSNTIPLLDVGGDASNKANQPWHVQIVG